MAMFAFRVQPQAPEPIYRQLVRQVREAVAAGGLKPGDRLPSLREAARELVISHLTVKQAYALLEREGLAVTRQGSGTFVAAAPSGRRLRREVEAGLSAQAAALAADARLAGLSRAEFAGLAERAWKKLSEETGS